MRVAPCAVHGLVQSASDPEEPTVRTPRLYCLQRNGAGEPKGQVVNLVRICQNSRNIVASCRVMRTRVRRRPRPPATASPPGCRCGCRRSFNLARIVDGGPALHDMLDQNDQVLDVDNAITPGHRPDVAQRIIRAPAVKHDVDVCDV